MTLTTNVLYHIYKKNEVISHNLTIEDLEKIESLLDDDYVIQPVIVNKGEEASY